MTLRYTPEQVEKLKRVKTSEDAKAFIESEGVLLSDAQMEIVIGGTSAEKYFTDNDAVDNDAVLHATLCKSVLSHF